MRYPTCSLATRHTPLCIHMSDHTDCYLLQSLTVLGRGVLCILFLWASFCIPTVTSHTPFPHI